MTGRTDDSSWLYIARPMTAEEGHHLHIWFGPIGLHLFWPDWWKSRPDFVREWR